jgi:hypothetical protein
MLTYIILKNSFRNTKKTQRVTIKEMNCLMLFREILLIYSENDTKPTKTELN